MSRPFITPAVVSALSNTLTRRASIVWLYVWSRADFDTSIAWPGTRMIAKDVGIKPGHVCEDVALLESQGWLTVNRSRGNKSSYVVLTPNSVYPKTGTPPPESVSQNGNPPCPKTGTPRAQKREQHPNSTKNRFKNSTKARGKAAAVVVVIPERLRGETFEAAWSDWLAYRRERKLTLTPRTMTAQLAKLAGWGTDGAIQAIRQSITQGWQGLFAPNGDNRGGKPKFDPVAAGRCPR